MLKPRDFPTSLETVEDEDIDELTISPERSPIQHTSWVDDIGI